MKIGIAGAAGKMGRALVRAVHEHPGLELASAWERKGHECLGSDAGQLAGVGTLGIAVSENAAECLGSCQVALDFTAPEPTLSLAKAAAASRCALVIGTTGFSDEQMGQLRKAGEQIPVVYSTNYSVGVNVLWFLAQEAARLLGGGFDAEIIEWHHNQKKDSPSGTALTLLESICKGKGLDPKQAVRHGRSGLVGPRSQGEIGMHAVRAGDIVGDHCALFCGPGERIELKHQAHSRDILARGAVRAAQWVGSQPKGFYHMSDVLGLKRN